MEALYRIKRSFYSALLNRDYSKLERQTHEVLAWAADDLGFYGA